MAMIGAFTGQVFVQASNMTPETGTELKKKSWAMTSIALICRCILRNSLPPSLPASLAHAFLSSTGLGDCRDAPRFPSPPLSLSLSFLCFAWGLGQQQQTCYPEGLCRLELLSG